MTERNPNIGNRLWQSLVRMKNGQPVAVDDGPFSWRTEGDERPTDEWLAEAGYFGLVMTPPPVVDKRTHKVVRNPLSSMIVDAEMKTVTETWTIVALTSAEIADARNLQERAVDAERDRRIHGGMIFAGKLFQTRLEDQKRIAGAGTLALAAVVQGAQAGNLHWHGGTSDFEWIAADNSMLAMDAQTVFAFGQKAATWERDHIFAARSLKSMEVIPADFVDDSYWPVLA